jgi:hypothetical protein
MTALWTYSARSHASDFTAASMKKLGFDWETRENAPAPLPWCLSFFDR